MLNALSDKIAQLAIVIGLLAQALAASPAVYEITPNAPKSESGEQTAITTNLAQKPVLGQDLPRNQGEIRSLIVKYARLNGISDFLALELAHLESRFEPEIKNPSSTATGIYQFLLGTWKTNCKGERTDPEDNIRCAMDILKEPTGIQHWTVVTSTRQQFLNLKLITCSDFNKNICKRK